MISALPRRLNSSLLPAAEIRAVSCSLDESTTAVPKATMVLPPGVTMHMHEMAELYVGQESHGYFRVVSVGAAIRNQTTVQLMGAADTLTDDIWAAEVSETSYDPDDLLRAALSHQSKAYWQAGNCDAAKAVKTAISYDDLWSVLEKIRAANPDCMWTYDYSTSPWTLSLVAMPDTVEAELRIGRNIESASVNITDKEMCNKLYMTVTTDSSSTLIVAENAESIAKYGTVIKKATVAAADAPNPQAYAEKILAERAEPLAYISISGLDLKAITGDDFDRIKLGSLCRAVIPEYGEGVLSERVVARKWPEIIHEPLRVTVSLANAVQTFQESLQFIRRTASSARSSASKTEKELTHWETIVTAQQTTLDDLGITGLWQSGLVLDAYQGVKIWSSEQGENSYLGQITINKNTIDQTVEAVGLVWDETANEGAGGWVPSSSPAAGSVAARLSLIPGQITAAASAVENNIKSEGYIKLQAAKNAAAAEIGAQLDNGTSSISAKVKALVEGDTSLIQLVADEIDLDGYVRFKSGTTDWIEASTISAESIVWSHDGQDDDLGDMVGALFDDTADAYTAIRVVADASGNTYHLEGKTVSSDSWDTIENTTFSRAASGVSVSWSGTTGTVTVLPQNQDFTITDDAQVSSFSLLKLGNSITISPYINHGQTDSGGNPTNERNSSSWNISAAAPALTGAIPSGHNAGTGVGPAPTSKSAIAPGDTVIPYVQIGGKYFYGSSVTVPPATAQQLMKVVKADSQIVLAADGTLSTVTIGKPAISTNKPANTLPNVITTLTPGQTFYPHVKVGDDYFYGDAITAPSGANVESSHPHTMSANTATVTPSNGYDAMAQVVVDATPRYYAGKAAVTLSDTPTWGTAPSSNITATQNTVTVSTSGRTNTSGTADERTKTINLYSNVTKSGLTATFYVTHTNSTDANRIIKREATFSDSNLTPENIKENVWIFGVKGSYTGSGGGSYGVFHGFTDEPVVSGEYTVYPGGTINGSKTIYAVIENSYGTPITGPSITVSAPTQPTIGPKSTTITSNGTYYASDDSKNGWSQVTVSVSSSTYSHNAQTNQISTDQIYVYYQGTYMTYRQRYGTDRYVCYTTTQLGSTVYW